MRLIRDLLAAKPSHKGTNIALALQTVNCLQKRRAIVFLISDFLENVEDYAKELALTASRHDVIAIILSDPLELKWQNVGLVALQDAETGMMRWVDTSIKGWTRQFKHKVDQNHDLRDAALAQANVDRIDLQSQIDYVPVLRAFFQGRLRRLQK